VQGYEQAKVSHLQTNSAEGWNFALRILSGCHGASNWDTGSPFCKSLKFYRLCVILLPGQSW